MNVEAPKTARSMKLKESNVVNYQNEKYDINVGKKVIEFDFNDPIFTLTRAVDTWTPSTSCHCCSDSLKKQKSKYCDFCGQRACEKCLHKSRRFQMPNEDTTRNQKNLSLSEISKNKSKSSSTVDTDTISFGKVCTICDRKFMVYSKYSTFLEEIKVK